MLNQKKIIAIFNKNFFVEELITLLEDEGLGVEKIKNIHKANESISNKVLLLDIDSKKKTGEFKSILTKKS